MAVAEITYICPQPFVGINFLQMIATEKSFTKWASSRINLSSGFATR